MGAACAVPRRVGPDSGLPQTGQVLRSGWVIGELQCGQRFIAVPSFFTLADAVNFAQHGCLYPEYIDREMVCQPSFLEKTHGYGRINLPRRRVVCYNKEHIHPVGADACICPRTHYPSARVLL